jgi:hypothetical protein
MIEIEIESRLGNKNIEERARAKLMVATQQMIHKRVRLA